MKRRTNFVFAHPHPVARLSMAVNAMDAVDELASAVDHVEEVTC